MPLKRSRYNRYKRKSRKRSYKRKGRMIRYRRMPPLGIPRRKLVRLKYVETISLDPVASGINVYTYSCNGMYDPNITGTGHQPLFFDQQMAGYSHYTVIGSKCRVTPSNPTTADIVPCQYGIMIDNNTTVSYLSSDEIVESSQGRYFKLAGPHNSPQTGFSNSLTRKWSARKFFGTKHVVAQDEYKGTTSANPSEQAYFQIWCGSIGNGDGGKVYFTVELEYIAVLSEPSYVAQS